MRDYLPHAQHQLKMTQTLPLEAAELATEARNAIAEIIRLTNPKTLIAWQSDENFAALQNAELSRQESQNALDKLLADSGFSPTERRKVMAELTKPQPKNNT